MGQTFLSPVGDQFGIDLVNLEKRARNLVVNPEVTARCFATSKVYLPLHLGRNRGRGIGIEVDGWRRFLFGNVVIGGHDEDEVRL